MLPTQLPQGNFWETAISGNMLAFERHCLCVPIPTSFLKEKNKKQEKIEKKGNEALPDL